MKAIYKKRLLKLAAFLDKLPRKKFNFGSIVYSKPKCGTVGCAIGWTPKVFPSLVEWDSRRSPSAVKACGSDNFGFAEVAMSLFGLSYKEANDLFDPCFVGYQHWTQPVDRVDADATPKQVAASIRRFIKWKEKQEASL